MKEESEQDKRMRSTRLVLILIGVQRLECPLLGEERTCSLIRISLRDYESTVQRAEIFPGIREADSEPRELRWTFYTEKLFDK